MLAAQIDETRRLVSPTLDVERRSALGQFMTPANVAEFMASNFDDLPDEVRLLDAGAGMGALTTAFVTEACSRSKQPSSIDATVYEVDEQLAAILEETLLSCADICADAGIQFSYRLIKDDYILSSAAPLLDKTRTYNCAILNPPYGKINSASNWRKALRSQGIETVNLYTAFVALAIQQMEEGGEIVAITPRSFCNGSYYEPFRRLMLDSAALVSLHVFESRRTAFKDDGVLQENIIFKIKKAGSKMVFSFQVM